MDVAAAVRILEALLRSNPTVDPAYELLVKLRGLDALPFMEELALADRFEERPLIWKAYAFLRERRLEEAEKAALAAVVMDPSDGETVYGYRMRVYSVLADIREKQGDPVGAAVLRRAVRAIRMSEEADELLDNHLVKRATLVYSSSLRLFADAYCIQSRLAVQLAEHGRYAEAEEHFRRAFQLMPVSFGRVETHCPGCEGVFNTAQARGIAASAFLRLAQHVPRRPQLQYLIAYLRRKQGRDREALDHLRQAVRLDPDYFSAWRLMLRIGEDTPLPLAEQDAALLAMMRLDPGFKHRETERAHLGTLKGNWTAAEMLRAQWAREWRQALNDRNARSAGLYILRGTAGKDYVPPRDDSGARELEETSGPGSVLARDGVLSAPISLFEIDLRDRRKRMPVRAEAKPSTIAATQTPPFRGNRFGCRG